MAVKIGISLIAWQNDDLPELTKDYTTEGAMACAPISTATASASAAAGARAT